MPTRTASTLSAAMEPITTSKPANPVSKNGAWKFMPITPATRASTPISTVAKVNVCMVSSIRLCTALK